MPTLVFDLPESLDPRRKRWRLMSWLERVFGEGCVNPEAPIDVAPEDNPTTEPDPDLIVLNRNPDAFLKGNPRPADLLVIEEYRVLDIARRRMIAPRDPQPGGYASVAAYAADESVSPLAAPEAHLRVGDTFPL